MGSFSKLSPEILARNKVMKRITDAVTTTYKQGRLIFSDNGSVEYRDKDGVAKTYTLEELSALFWDKMNTEMGQFNPQANLAILNITTDDILKVIVEVGGSK